VTGCHNGTILDSAHATFVKVVTVIGLLTVTAKLRVRYAAGARVPGRTVLKIQTILDALRVHE
jgi:hypothetical protein